MAYDAIKIVLSELDCEWDQDLQIYYNGTNVGFIERKGDGVINIVYETEDFENLSDLENIYCFTEELSSQTEIPYKEVILCDGDAKTQLQYSRENLSENIRTLESLLQRIESLPIIESKRKNRRHKV
ncbi:MAG: hypothetical protein WC867_04055 [Candidatus Pacearchaeota archaeon]|jgi:hypothetical protein